MTSLGRPFFKVESKRKGISLHLLAKELDFTFYSSRSVRGEGNGMKKRGESKEAKRGNAGMNSFSWCHIYIFHFFKTSQGFQPLPQLKLAFFLKDSPFEVWLVSQALNPCSSADDATLVLESH